MIDTPDPAKTGMTSPVDPALQFSDREIRKLQSYTSALPYTIESNDEMQYILDLYLTRIAQCIEAKDYDPGFLQWDSMLNYWRLLKHPIPKAKRIALAKLYYDVCTVPGMPLHIVSTCNDTLSWLLRSKKKLSVNDMRLPWKPVYNILSKDLFLSRRQFEITQTSYQMALLSEVSRRFFHPACGEEMLEAILPSLNGLDLNSVLAAQYYLNTFLPLSHPTWLPMLMQIWSAVNSYMFDERHFALLASLAEMHLDPSISDPARLDQIPDDARLDEHGTPETGKRERWSSGTGTPDVGVSGANGQGAGYKLSSARLALGVDTVKSRLINDAKPWGPSGQWKGLFKDVGIFTQDEWDLIMCKCLASMEIPLADGGSFTTGPVVDEQAGFEFSRLPKPSWRIYSLAKLIVYSMAPDGKQLPKSGTATPFEIPVTGGGDYFSVPAQAKADRKYLAGCKALDSLARMIVSLESFFHPSNSGSWTTDLSAFLKYVVFEFSKRWHDESQLECKVPPSRRLTREMRRELVRCLRTPAFLAMFSNDSETVSNIQSALKSMTVMEPDLIVPPVLERAVPSLEALVETQRTLAVIKALGAVALGIVARDVYYGGAKHLVQILELLLPGIDLNDPLKTICTTAFLIEISQQIKFSDLTVIEPAAVSSDTTQASWSPATTTNPELPQVRIETENVPDTIEDAPVALSTEEEDAILRDSTSGFANWVSGFIRRVILLLENLPEEDASSGSSESTVVSAVAEACSQICAHLSEPLFDLVLDLIYDFATTTVRANAVRAVHQLVECVARASPRKTLARFVPFALKNIHAELQSGASSIRSTTYSHIQPSDATLHWNIAILRGAFYHAGEATLPYRGQLLDALQLLHEKTLSKRGFSFTGKLLYSLMETLTHTYTLENRFVNPEEWDSEEFRQSQQKHWGRLYRAEDVQIQWHVPSNEEVSYALELFKLCIEPALDCLEGLLSTGLKDSVWSNDFCRHLSFVRHAFASTPTLCQEFISPDDLRRANADSDVLNELPEFIASVATIKAGYILDDPEEPRYQYVAALRARFARFLHSASTTLLHHGDENTLDAVLMLIRSCRTCLLDYGDSRYSYYTQEGDYAEEVGVTRRYANQKLWPRAIFVRRAQLYHTARLRWTTLDRRRTTLQENLIDDLVNWSVWNYPIVRSSAQGLLESLTVSYDGVRKRCLPVLYKHLIPGSDDDSMKGALYTLDMSAFSKYAIGEPTLAPTLVRHLFQCQWNEKPSIQNCVTSVAESCITGFVEPCFLIYQVDYPPIVQSIRNLLNVLSGRHLDSTAVVRCEANRIKRVKLQELAVDELSDFIIGTATDSVTHWRYSIGAIRLLRTIIRRDSGVKQPLMEYMLSQARNNHPSMRYYAQRAIMKATRYIKIRTFAASPEDLIMFENKNPLKQIIKTSDKTHEFTASYLEVFSAPINWNQGAEEMLFEDKETSGWLAWDDRVGHLVPPKRRSALQPWDQASSGAVMALKKAAYSSKFWEELSSFFTEENHQESTVADNMSCVKSIVQIAEEQSFESIRPIIEKLLDDTDQNKQRGAAELLGGLVVGSKHWPSTAQKQLWDWFTPIISRVLGSNVKTDTLTVWSTFLEYVLSHKDPRRVYPLVDWLIRQGEEVDFTGESSFEPIRVTFFLRATIDALGWRSFSWIQQLAKVYWDEIGCEHDEVTSYIADGLAAFCNLHWRPNPTLPTVKNFVQECGSRPAEDDIMGIKHGYRVEQFRDFVSKLPELRAARLGGANAPRSPYDRMLTTVIRWLYQGLQELNAVSTYQYLVPLLPELFHAAELQDSDDLARRAQTILTVLCGVTMPATVVTDILEVIFDTIRSSPSWRIRSNTLPMLQILYFRQAPIISEATLTKIQDVLSESLSDEVVEVREKAATTLSGILRCSPRRTILILKDRFVRRAAVTALPKRNSPLYTVKLRELHAAILGVTALISAFPYSVPSWLPELIGEVLSRHTYDPIPISTTVRKCATKFKETHQDTWHEDSLKFDEEQLSALTTLLAGSSYYA